MLTPDSYTDREGDWLRKFTIQQFSRRCMEDIQNNTIKKSTRTEIMVFVRIQHQLSMKRWPKHYVTNTLNSKTRYL